MDDRSVNPEVRAGDPIHAAGVRILANLLASEECNECGIDLDTLAGEGIPHVKKGWQCKECSELDRW